MKSKRILVVAESIDIEDSSGSKANVALIQNLVKAGFEVRVYHYTRKDIRLDEIPCFPLREKRKSFLFFLSRLERQLRVKCNISLNKYIEAVLGFSFTHLNDKNSIAAGLKKIKGFTPDLVLTLSKGSSFRPHHSLLHIPEWHDRWISYIHDPYPMHSYPRPYDWVEPGHQEKRKFFKRIAKCARYAAYPSKLLAEWMESYYPDLRGKSIIIPHQNHQEEQKREGTQELPQQSIFSIVHAGNLLSARNPLPLIEGFRKFLKENKEAKQNCSLTFVGPQSAYSSKFEKIKEVLPQLYWSEGSLPYDQVLAIQHNAAVNIILESKGPLSPFLPGKFPHCIAARKPILLLGPFYSETRRLLGMDYEYWAEIDDVVRISELLKLLYFQWKQKPESFRLVRPDLEDYLSPSYLKEIIDSL